MFIALHGRFGEDGTVQGALEALGIPYTGSGVMASALAMDKWRTEARLARAAAFRRRAIASSTPATDWMGVVAELGLPLIVKPAREGSTIGITKVADGRPRRAGDRLSPMPPKHDDLVLVEEFVAGVELTASILGERALPLIRIEAPQGNYDYHNKYFSRRDEVLLSVRACPTRVEREIRAQSLRGVPTSSAARGWGRLDLILRDRRRLYSFLEVNTSPGMTGHSLVPMAARRGRHGLRRSLRRDPARRPCGMTRGS